MNKELLTSFADNPLLMAAVKEAVLKKFSFDDVNVNYPNDVLGQMARARLEGCQKVEEAFKEISNYKTIEKKAEAMNPAR